ERPVGGEVHVQLDEVGAERQRLAERAQAVLGPEARAAAVRGQPRHWSPWGAPIWPPSLFKRRRLRPPRTPPANARTRPGGAVARLGVDTGCLTGPLLGMRGRGQEAVATIALADQRPHAPGLVGGEPARLEAQ